MEWAVRVAAFYEKAKADNRISPVHIALYFALLNEASKSGVNLIIPVRSRLMVLSKVYSTVTYHRCLRELHEYGYIIYRPSYVAGMTRIELITLS